MSQTRSYTVTGMTCQHCVASVTEEVQEVPGVQSVDVDLATGGLTVTLADDAAADLDDTAIRVAVEEAGYQLA
jgi:copper chaperone CopZ